KSIKEDKKALEDKLKILDTLKKGRTGPVKVLDELATIIPQKVWIVDFNEQGGAVAMNGAASSYEALSNFSKKLKASTHFSNITITTARQGTLHALEDELIQKQSIANNLAQFKHEKEILERRLAQALTELPNEANIDDLIRSLSEIGTKSGLAINSIEPQAEQRQSFYASIPIVMEVSGKYHEIVVFLG